MTLVRTSLLNGIAVVVKTLAAFLLNKLLAVFVGPSGYAAIGQLQNAISIVFTFASGAIGAGVTKYTAEHFDDHEARMRVWRAASFVSLAGSALAAVAMAVLHRQLAELFLKDPGKGYVFLWLAGGMTFYVLNALLLSILQGLKQVGRFVAANIGGSLVTLALTGVLVSLYGLPGALVGLAINQSAALLVTAALCLKTGWFTRASLFGAVDPAAVRNLLRFSLMALASAIAAAAAQVAIRTHLGETFGWDRAGYWEAMNRISGLFLAAVTATFSLYYLPRMSELRERRAVRKELLATGPMVVAATAVLCLALFLAREWAVLIAFDASFAPMERLFAWQLTGDVLRMASWLFAYLFVAKGLTSPFMVIEIGSNLLYVGLVHLFTAWWGWEAAVTAYAVIYLLYGLLCAAALRRLGVI